MAPVGVAPEGVYLTPDRLSPSRLRLLMPGVFSATRNEGKEVLTIGSKTVEILHFTPAWVWCQDATVLGLIFTYQVFISPMRFALSV